MSSTAMRIKNGSDDVQTITAKINIGFGYGSADIEKDKWGSIDCELVWYTLNCYDKNNVLLSSRLGCYGRDSFELTGSEGDYIISKV